MKTKNHRKNTLGTTLFLKLFDSEFDKLTLAEMQEIRDIAAAKCKDKELSQRRERPAGASRIRRVV